MCKYPVLVIYFRVGPVTLTGGMSPFLAEAPGGDTLLDVHPTQLQMLYKGYPHFRDFI